MASSQTIAVNKAKQDIDAALNRLPQVLQGSNEARSLVRKLQVRIGLTILGIIHRAFAVKSIGMTDAAGLRWKPLSPYTIAARRDQQKRAGQAHTALVKKERALWHKYYRQALQSMNEDSAARYAWQRARREGLMTLSGRGGQLARILVDSGQLIESLKPSVPPASANFMPQPRRLQIFRLARGYVEVGTRRKYAKQQHTGLPGRRPPLPQRRLWPILGQWPAAWWARILKEVLAGVEDIVIYLARK